MPRPLRVVYNTSWILVAIGWVVTVGIGQIGPPDEAPWLPLLTVAMLIALPLALGFSEDERWTRPLMVLILLLPAGIFLLLGFLLRASVAAIPAVLAGIYLYSSPAVKRYYEFLREGALVRFTVSDLWNPYFISFYVCASGIGVGGWLGYSAVVFHLGYSSGLGMNDLVAIVCAAVLGAGVLGRVGWWIGDAIVDRWFPPTEDGDQARAA